MSIKDSFKDLSGIRFGRLSVVEYSHTKNWSRFWKCVCDCGNVVTIKSASLTRSKEPTRSCGCLQRESVSRLAKSINRKRLPEGEANFNKLYSRYRYNAEIRELEFYLDKEDFRLLTKEACFYCGCSPQQIFSNGSKSSPTGVYVYNGIDRLIDSKGYTLSNCVPCCGRCNKSKNDMDVSEFIEWIKTVYEHLQGTWI